MVSGVKQQPTPSGEIVSQLPPVAATAVALKRMVGPVLAIVKSCGSGFAPPNGMVKLMGFTWLKTLSPTTTLMGMVTLLLADRNANCPTNVPATTPPPGKFAGVML